MPLFCGHRGEVLLEAAAVAVALVVLAESSPCGLYFSKTLCSVVSFLKVIAQVHSAVQRVSACAARLSRGCVAHSSPTAVPAGLWKGQAINRSVLFAVVWAPASAPYREKTSGSQKTPWAAPIRCCTQARHQTHLSNAYRASGYFFK